ncbi:autotransporter outer membrane beta-barrel domain-containing protein [Helicobacter winghamensis]|uniref:autotransporter outer membrane beta-barrel domain-containing protein n=1 Tax=Helicobacter winghamensis TaxID=157268 RepID=UPI00279F4429
MIFLRGGGAFKRYLNPFTSKAIYYSVLATSLSTFIFHSPAYAESLEIDNNFTPSNKYENKNFDKVDFQNKELKEKSVTINFAGNNTIKELTSAVLLEDLKAQLGVDVSGNNYEITRNKWLEYFKDKGYANKPEDFFNDIPKLSIKGDNGSTINIDSINNKGSMSIKADTLNVTGDIKTSNGYLNIYFNKGTLGAKGHTIGFEKTDLVIDDYFWRYLSITTNGGTIASDISDENASGGIQISVNNGGEISGNIWAKDRNAGVADGVLGIYEDMDYHDNYILNVHQTALGITGPAIYLNNNSKMTGDLSVGQSKYATLSMERKSLMTGKITLAESDERGRGGTISLVLDDSEITSDIKVGKNSEAKIDARESSIVSGEITAKGEGASIEISSYKYDPTISPVATSRITGQITASDKAYIRIHGQKENSLAIEKGIINNGGTIAIVNLNDRYSGQNINGISFKKAYENSGYHFKNTNSGTIAIDGWDFKTNGRVIIDTNGDNKNLENVAFGAFEYPYDDPNALPSDAEECRLNPNLYGCKPILLLPDKMNRTITLFGDDKIFAQGSYVQYLVLTPEEEKDLKDGKISIYDKDGRHNVAGHFIEGGAGANGESNFATLLSEGKVIKLSVGGGDTIAPVVQADGLIGELKVNDDTPGSTIGSNQINALNTNMTQTFNTIKEISTKTFRTEHTNHLSSNTLKEQVAYALYNHSKNVSKNNSLDNNPINKNLSSNNLKNHTNNNLLSYNAKNNSLNDNINLLDNTSNPGNTNIASNVSNINALTNPASNTSENNTLSNASNNTNLEAYITDEQITTYATYAQAGASDALFYDEINKGYTDLDLLRALDDIFIKQNKKESDLYTYAVPYYNYIKDKSLGLGTTKTNSYGLLAGGQLNSNYGVYGFYINLENSKRENNTTSTDTDSTSYLAGLTYYNAFHRFSNKELYVSLNTMLGTTKSDVSMIDSDSYKDDFDFDSLNYGAELRAGVNIYNVLTNSYWTPELGLIYTGMAVDSYEIKHTKLTEYYDKTTINLLEGVAGLRFHHAYNQTTRFNAALGAKFRLYDDAKSQMKIAGETLANPLFATRDIKLPDTSYYVQFGLVKLLGDNVELSLNYQGNFAKDIQGHTAFARIGYWW